MFINVFPTVSRRYIPTARPVENKREFRIWPSADQLKRMGEIARAR